jgi:hypothetical protein
LFFQGGAVRSPIKESAFSVSYPIVSFSNNMQFSKFLPFLATLVPLASAIQFTLEKDLKVHTCPGYQTKLTWDYVDTDPKYANLYESAQNGNLDNVKPLAWDVKIADGFHWITNTHLIKAVAPATGVRFRLGNTKEQIFAESSLVYVVCPASLHI